MQISEGVTHRGRKIFLDPQFIFVTSYSAWPHSVIVKYLDNNAPTDSGVYHYIKFAIWENTRYKKDGLQKVSMALQKGQ